MFDDLISDLHRKISRVNKCLGELKNSNENSTSSRLLDLVQSDEWPLAISPFQMIDESSEDQKIQRASAIASQFNLNKVDGLSFLDFGCGEGHVVDLLSETTNARFCIGYDIVDKFKQNSNCLLTVDKQVLQKHAPYDIILMYDVVDHIERGLVESELKFVKSLLSDGGKVLVRCHPWCSRHGSHYHKVLNKAFVHLVLTEKELGEAGVTEKFGGIKVLYPMVEYRRLFSSVGFRVEGKPIQKIQEVETFFKRRELIKGKIQGVFRSKNFPEKQMQQTFIDYTLL